ncbi:MAG TPA: aminotransferase class V-fold PLP-dependent enzyme, partial [Bacteroidetes bacterium]|nr:aminotransferase class V-fold PLP-dependent enzyme [Bacteroidota bacterium]
MKIYFDNANFYKPDKKTLKYFKSQFDKFYGNSKTIHFFGKKTKAEIENSRHRISSILNVEPNQIVFSSNAFYYFINTVNNLFSSKYNSIITSKFEHPEILEEIQKYSRKNNVPVIFAETDEDSGINTENFKKIVEKKPNSLVSLSHVNMLTGKYLPIKKISKYSHNNNCDFHCNFSHTV